MLSEPLQKELLLALNRDIIKNVSVCVLSRLTMNLFAFHDVVPTGEPLQAFAQ